MKSICNTNHINYKLMKPNQKEMYCIPEAKTFEVKIEGVICGSGDVGVQNYNWNDYKEE